MDRTVSSRKATAVAACAFVWLALGLSGARAGFTVVLDSTAPEGGATVFNYSAKIASGDSIVAGDFFRIYDFGGYVAGSAVAPLGWAVTVSNLDLPPLTLSLSHGDDAAIPNLTFTYVGTTPITGGADVAGFSAISPYNGAVVLANFVGTNHNSVIAGGLVDTIGDVNVPKVGAIFPSPVPEPASLVSSCLGLTIAGLYLGRRIRRMSAAR